MPKETYVPCLFQLFRQYGYDGATLSKISQTTGLGKASLYHHFPGGKDEMVEAVLDFSANWLEQNIVQTLASPGDAVTRLTCMGDRLMALYENGNQPCLLANLLLGSARDLFRDRLKTVFCTWIEAIAGVLIESGIDPGVAKQRGENAVIAIQGSLLLSQALGDPSPFQRCLQQLPHQLTASEAESNQSQ